MLGKKASSALLQSVNVGNLYGLSLRAGTLVSPPSRYFVDGCEIESPSEIANALADFGGGIASEPSGRDDVDCERDGYLGEVSAHFVPIVWPSEPISSIGEFSARLKRAPKTSPGPDGVRYSHLFGLGASLTRLLVDLYEAWILRGTWCASLSMTHFVALPKPNQDSCPTPSSIRPFALSNCLGKALTGQLSAWLAGIVPQHILDIQHGFLQGRSTIDALLDVEYYSLTSAPLSDTRVLLLLDVARAFPSLVHEHMYDCMIGAGAPQWLLRAVMNLYNSLEGRFVFRGRLSETFN